MLPQQRPPADDNLTPYIGYVRVSTWKEEKISPELQQAAIEAWATRTRCRIIRWIEDRDQTGRNFKRKIMKGITAVEAREARGIAVWKYSRFGRNRDGIAVNLKRLEDAGGQLASATEDVDARTATGKLQRGILFEFAAYESDVRGEQWKETHDHRRYKLHLPSTGRPRFGYLWTPRRVPDAHAPSGWRLQDETYKAHPDTGPVMADRYRQYVDGGTFYSLVADLNSAGWRTVRGGPWSQQTLTRYMDSGFPAGLLRVHNPECRCPQESRGYCGNTLFIPGAQEELIDAELWQAYQDRRAEVKATPPRARRALYTLTNLIKHDECRGTVPAQSAQRVVNGLPTNIQGYAYACGRRAITAMHGCGGVWATRTRVEDLVLNWLKTEAAPQIDEIPMVPAPRREPADGRVMAARERARLEAEAAKLANALTNLRTDRAMNPEDYGPGEYEAARDRIRQQQSVNTAAMERAAAVESTPHRADYAPAVMELVDIWEDAHDSEKNALLKQLVRRVALIRTDAGATIEVHPVWEPDPWVEAEAEATE
ncbi:recombinase family protein [Streptomyces sp. NPDC056831]|uniref:recombinase family protein n=1 Tax=Streptomyces sp. NPDC056831 TaxID=3345954 RepID=UPI0036A099B9